jgi:chromate transporter
MTRVLTPDRTRAGIALTAAIIIILSGGSLRLIAAIALGALAGLALCRSASAPPSALGHLNFPVSRRGGAAALGLFAVLFVVAPLIAKATGNQGVALFNAFYRSGALVFGGGHVVLPLLQAEVVSPGWVTNAAFLRAMEWHKPCLGRSSHSPPISALQWDRRPTALLVAQSHS